MPYALFSNDAKLSKAYPTEADVWKHARLSGLVVDVATEDDKPAPRPVLDNDYEIKPCRPDPQIPPRTRPTPSARPNWISSCIRESTFPEPNEPLDYGVATASEACSAASVTQAFLRCSPLIAPVTLSTFPAGQEASCTKATS